MKVPVKWLKDYVNIDVGVKELGEAMTLSGSMVEEIIQTGEVIDNVVTGRIVKIEKHPDAENLVICLVDIGKEELLQIVTAAKNMKENDIVPTALHGSTLAGGVKIKKGKLRGVVSNGMFCSEEELGIAGDNPVHGLMILPQNTAIGKDIKQILNLNRPVLDFEITSNRPDCLSIIGIARETAATFNESYVTPAFDYIPKSSDKIEDTLKVEVKDKLCKRYMARAVKNIKIQPSPGWMQDRLLEAGMRPINNIVDITNFVMIEMGQPLHAFDRREISTNKIVVERAKDGEEFTTLDNVKRILNKDVLNIKNGETTIGIAGIMGGLDSEIKDDTTSVIFESANFDGVNIRISSKVLALRTEASGRFEKDIDPNLAQLALDRVCNLISELGAGDILDGTIDIYPQRVDPHTMEVDINWVNYFLGTQISGESMRDYLNRLELCTEIENGKLKINVPTFRSDINIREDIAEEIARIYGYNNIPTTLIKAVSSRGGKSLKQKLDDKVIETMIASGLDQSISYSFVSPKVFDKIKIPADSKLRGAVKIRNPLGEDFSIMRTTVIPSMLESLARNYSRNNETARLFEIGKIYIPTKDENKLPHEVNTLIIGMYGNGDYFNLKGIVENIVDALEIEHVTFERESENPTFHPGKTATLMIKNQKAGVIGEIHPDVAENYGIGKECYIAELDMDVLYKCSHENKGYVALPKFPAVARDLAMLVDDSVMVSEIEDIISKQGGKLVETIKLFDVYKGKQIPEGKKSVAYSIIYRHADKTLVDEEVNCTHEKITKALETKLNAILR